MKAIAFLTRLNPCTSGQDCDLEFCIYGHHCPSVTMVGKEVGFSILSYLWLRNTAGCAIANLSGCSTFAMHSVAGSRKKIIRLEQLLKIRARNVGSRIIVSITSNSNFHSYPLPSPNRISTMLRINSHSPRLLVFYFIKM